MTPAQFWEIEMQNQRNAMQMQQQANLAAQQQQREMVGDIGSAVGQFAGMYAENKAMDAKAKSYDKIGEILGSSMFSNNDVAMNALGELKKSKDPREKVMGYETLFSLMGPYSNFMMAQRNAGIREDQQALTARLPGIREGAENDAAVASGLKTYSPPDLQNIVPPPTPAGFASIYQGMPGSSAMPVWPTTRPMAVRPGK